MISREVTPLILTFNEAPNLGRTLEKLGWAREIVVVDSFSTDQTVTIANSFPQVRVVQRQFDNHAAQWNFGVEQCATRWVLALDADYVLSDELVEELKSFKPEDGIIAYFVRFRYCIRGRPLRGTLYPPRAVLFLKEHCHYHQDGHTQLLHVDGRAGQLKGSIDHDDRKPLDQWVEAQNRYARLEAGKLTCRPPSELSVQDRIRRHILFAPTLVFFYTLFGKGLILDGWPGWYYVFQRTLAEVLLSLRLIEAQLRISDSDLPA